MAWWTSLGVPIKDALTKGLDLAIAANEKIRNGSVSPSMAISDRVPGISPNDAKLAGNLVYDEIAAGRRFDRDKPKMEWDPAGLPINPFLEGRTQSGERVIYQARVRSTAENGAKEGFSTIEIQSTFGITYDEYLSLLYAEVLRRADKSPEALYGASDPGNIFMVEPETVSIVRVF